MSLSEEEADVFSEHGSDGVHQYRADMESEYAVQDAEGDTPLHALARKGELWLVDRKEISQYYLSIQNKHGDTIVHEAALNGELAVLIENVESTLSFFNKPVKFSNYHLLTTDADGFTPVHFAAMYGHLDQIKGRLILKMMTTADSDGRTPLDHAIERGHKEQAIEVISELLPAYGQAFILEGKAKEIAKAFTAENLGTELEDTSTITHTLAAAHALTVASPVLNSRLLAAVNKDGWNPVHVAASCGCLDQIPAHLLTDSLLAARCSEDGNTVYHIAASAGSLGQIPVEHMAEERLTERNAAGKNTAHLAAAKGVLHLFPEHLLSPDLLRAKDAEGRTAFDLARDSQNANEISPRVWEMESPEALPLPTHCVRGSALSVDLDQNLDRTACLA